MINKNNYDKHYEETTDVAADAKTIFAYADDHTNFSTHMNQPSLMMGGGKMETSTDDGKGKKIGSHIKMKGKVFGYNLNLDEVIIQHNPPYRKAWETVGPINLIVIDHYKLGFEIAPDKDISKLKVYIDYDLPISWKTRWLGVLFGGMYSKWCVRQMSQGIKKHFQRH